MKFLPIFSLLLSPTLAFAAPRDFQGVVAFIVGFIALLVPVIIGITFVYILWGLVKAWIIDGGSEESVATGKMIAITGVIGLIVMVGIWGIVSLVRSAIFF